MPLYEYECAACRTRFELIQRFSDPPAATCAKCGAGPVRKLVSSPAFQFKGSGWYITDYARKPEAPPKTGESAGSGDSASTAANESATAAQTETPAAKPVAPAVKDS